MEKNTLPTTLPANFNFGTANLPQTLPANFDFNGATPTSQPSEGFGSGTVQAYQEYKNQTPAMFAANEGNATHAFAPATTQVEGDGSFTNQILNPALNATKVIPNTASDFIMNFLPGLAGIAGSVLKSTWDLGKGAFTQDFNPFYQDIHDSMLGQLARDPSVLAGPAIRTVGLGLAAGAEKFWNGDAKGGLNDILAGFQNGVTAFEDAPFSSVIAFKALGGITDALTHPIDTATAIATKAKGAVDFATHPIDWITKNMPETMKIETTLGMSKQIDAYNKMLTDAMDHTQAISESQTQLTSEDLSAAERTALETKIANSQDALKSVLKQQQVFNQMMLGSTEDGLRIASPQNPDATVENITKLAEDTTSQSRAAYQELLPKTPPNYTLVLDGLKKWIDGIDTLNDPGTAAAATKYFNDLSQRVALNEAWQNAGENPQTFLKMAYKAGSGIDPETAIKFSENPQASEFRLPSTADLKANANGVLRTMKEDSPLTNTKIQYNETVQPAIDSTIENDVQKYHGDEGLKRYKDSNQQWGDAQNVAKQILKRVETASDKTAENTLRNNLDLISKLDPTGKLADQVRSYFASKVLEDALTDTGYDPQKILDGVNKYRDVLRDSDKGLLTEQADAIARSQASLDEITAKEKIIGSNTIEMAQNIGKIKTLADLQKFTELSGQTPEQLGAIYRQSLWDEVTKTQEVGGVKGETDIAAQVKEFLTKEKQLGGKSGEAAEVYRQMTPPELRATFKNMEEQANYVEELAGKKSQSAALRVAKAGLGVTMFFLGHGFFGSSMIRSSFRDAFRSTPEPLPIEANATGDLVRNTPVKPVKPTLSQRATNAVTSPVGLTASVQANANEGQTKGDYITEEEATSIGLPKWMIGNYTDAHLKADLNQEEPPTWFSDMAQQRWPNLNEKEAWDKIKSLQ